MKKTTITWTACTIKLHAPNKHSINGHPEDTCTDAEINATNQFVLDWVRTHPNVLELFRMNIDNGMGIAHLK